MSVREEKWVLSPLTHPSPPLFLLKRSFWGSFGEEEGEEEEWKWGQLLLSVLPLPKRDLFPRNILAGQGKGGENAAFFAAFFFSKEDRDIIMDLCRQECLGLCRLGGRISPCSSSVSSVVVVSRGGQNSLWRRRRRRRGRGLCSVGNIGQKRNSPIFTFDQIIVSTFSHFGYIMENF